jgi:hypothetical protein
MHVPKIIWTLWLQGWDLAPAVVKSCLKTWQTHNENWTLHALTMETLGNFIDTETVFSTVDARSQRSAVFNRRTWPLVHLTICSLRIRWSKNHTSRRRENPGHARHPAPQQFQFNQLWKWYDMIKIQFT